MLPLHAGAVEPKPLTGAAQIAQARRELDALNEKVDAAVEDFNVGTIELAKAAKKAQVAQRRVTRSREQLSLLQKTFGSVASAAYRGGAAGDFVTLVTTSSPQTFLDKASALDHISRSKQEQMLALQAANRELRVQSATHDQALAQRRVVAGRLAKTKAAIDKDVASQERLLKALEVDEAKRIAAEQAAERARIAAARAAERARIAAERAAERKRQAVLAAERAAKARLAQIEAAKRARASAAAQARLVAQGRAAQAARLARVRIVRAAEEAAAEREARAAEAAAQAAASAEAAPEPEPAPEPDPAPEPAPSPEPAPEPANGGNSRGQIAVRSAYQQLGKRYVWAADGPDTFDCSGLTMFVWAKAGVSLSHSSRAQFNEGRRVSKSELRPGDLVFYGSPIHHVGIFIGGDQYIAAPQTGDVVRIKNINRPDWTGAVRL